MIEPLAQHVHHSLQLAWGDVPTWALFAGAFVAALIALRQMRIQQEDSVRKTTLMERELVDKVDFTWTPADMVLMLGTSGQLATPGYAVVIVSNDSSRPIRRVASRIEKARGGGTLKPVMLGVMTKGAVTSGQDYTMYNPRPGTQVPLIRPGFKYGFVFEYAIPKDDPTQPEPEDRPADPFITFTDDTDLPWEIGYDLRLKKLRPPRPPWHGLMGPPDPARVTRHE